MFCFCLCACIQQQIMTDRWMNVGHEEEELMPYIEPQPDYKDPKRTGQHPGSAGGWKRGGADVWCWWAGQLWEGERVEGDAASEVQIWHCLCVLLSILVSSVSPI